MVAVKTFETSYNQRCYVQALRFEAGWTFQKIADNQKLSVGTVWNICNGPATPKKRKGRPLTLDSPTRRRLVYTASLTAENRRKSYAEIAEICGVKACEKTLQKAFQLEGCSRQVSYNIVPKAGAKAKRLRFALDYRHWTKEDWRRIVWADKCYFRLGEPGQNICDTGRLGDDCFGEHREGSVMVWGGSLCGKKTSLVLWDKDNRALTAETYINHVLQPILWPFWYWESQAQGVSVWVIDDEASTHTAKLIRSYRDLYRMPSFILPPSCLDLNPMANLWNLIKGRLNQRSPRPEGVEEMREAIKEEWDKIGPSEILEFVDNIPERLEAIIAASGGHTQS